jgi:hypothetical protein
MGGGAELFLPAIGGSLPTWLGVTAAGLSEAALPAIGPGLALGAAYHLAADTFVYDKDGDGINDFDGTQTTSSLLNSEVKTQFTNGQNTISRVPREIGDGFKGIQQTISEKFAPATSTQNTETPVTHLEASKSGALTRKEKENVLKQVGSKTVAIAQAQANSNKCVDLTDLTRLMKGLKGNKALKDKFFLGELKVLLKTLTDVAKDKPSSCVHGLDDLKRAIKEIIPGFPVWTIASVILIGGTTYMLSQQSDGTNTVTPANSDSSSPESSPQTSSTPQASQNAAPTINAQSLTESFTTQAGLGTAPFLACRDKSGATFQCKMNTSGVMVDENEAVISDGSSLTISFKGKQYEFSIDNTGKLVDKQ